MKALLILLTLVQIGSVVMGAYAIQEGDISIGICMIVLNTVFIVLSTMDAEKEANN